MSRRSKGKAGRGKATAAMPPSAAASPAGEMPGVEGSLLLESKSRPAGWHDRWTVVVVCLVLAAMTWVVFGQTLGHEFVNYDDNLCITDNLAVLRGLSLKGIGWAFTHTVSANWTPLTVISHMLDCQLHGTNAGWHHLTSVLLHMASVIVLFLVLKEMTAAFWRSAFVAAVFAIHPLRVESVAWVAERKDVLSGLFFMLTIGAYVRYARRPWSPARYGLVVLLFALGLMCKPMLVTLPFVLLLLDCWPLGRVTGDKWQVTGGNKGKPSTLNPVNGRGPHGTLRPQLSTLLLEKLPLLGLAGAVCVATLFAQKVAIAPLPLPLRIGNALVSCVAYLGQMIYPAGLAVYYPHPESGLALWKIIAAFALLLIISVGAIAARQKRPWFLFGWLWYLGMLVPVIGILQVGSQARADRYTYLPQIGLYVLLTWAAADLCAGSRHRRVVLGSLSTIILVALIFCARTQVSYWRNSESLWTHTLAVTPDNSVADDNFGLVLFQKGQADEAIAHYQKALALQPDFPNAHYNLGNALVDRGRVDEAMSQFQQALKAQPDFAEAHNNLGQALLKKGRVDEAVAEIKRALEIQPDFAAAHNNLGDALVELGRADEAMAELQKALEIRPDLAEAHNNLGAILFRKGQMGEAIAHYQKALEIKPASAEIQNNLAWALATGPQASLRNGNRAVELAQRANQLAGNNNPVLLFTLATAYAEAGRFSEAVETAQRALQLAEAQSNTALADDIRSEIKLYEAGVPFHSH